MEAVPGDREGGKFVITDLDAGGVGIGVEFGVNGQAGLGGGRGDALDDDFMAGQGPRQFMVMWENSRCSIRFHFDVPGGRWQTVTVNPVSAANRASSVFQVRVR